MLNRRIVLLSAAMLPVALTRCATGTAPTLAQVQMYATDIVDALSAAAEAYVASPQAAPGAATIVNSAIAALQSEARQLAAATSGESVQTIVAQVIQGAQLLVPYLTPFLGAAAPYVPLGLAVLQAFVQSLPMPAPAIPPAALHAKAQAYRMTHQ